MKKAARGPPFQVIVNNWFKNEYDGLLGSSPCVTRFDQAGSLRVYRIIRVIAYNFQKQIIRKVIKIEITSIARTLFE